MGYKDITPGNKVGRPTAARFIKSPKKGTIGLEVSFSFYEPTTGIMENLNWVAWLSPPAIDKSMDTLVNVLGFNGNDTCNEDGTLADKNALAWGVDVSLVIELEAYEGKQYPKIRWVNRMGGASFEGLKPETIQGELSALGFKSAFLAAKQAKDSLTTNEVPF